MQTLITYLKQLYDQAIAMNQTMGAGKGWEWLKQFTGYSHNTLRKWLKGKGEATRLPKSIIRIKVDPMLHSQVSKGGGRLRQLAEEMEVKEREYRKKRKKKVKIDKNDPNIQWLEKHQYPILYDIPQRVDRAYSFADLDQVVKFLKRTQLPMGYTNVFFDCISQLWNVGVNNE